jgi:hypothetical protein
MEEELAVLESIYGDELEGPDHCGWWRIRICDPLYVGGVRDSEGMMGDAPVKLSFSLHGGYPDLVMPLVRLEGTGIDEVDQTRVIELATREIFSPQEPIMFSLISWLMSELPTFLGKVAVPLASLDPPKGASATQEPSEPPLRLIHGTSISDRKSRARLPPSSCECRAHLLR